MRSKERYSFDMQSMTLKSVTLMAAGLALLLPLVDAVSEEAPLPLLNSFDDYTQLERLDPVRERNVRDYLIPLGAIEKIRGKWSPRDSERQSGILRRYTWRVSEGYSSEEFVESMDLQLAGNASATLLFSCNARACGSSVQWANRIFEERLLYGTEASQRYRVYTLVNDAQRHRLLIYGSARSSDRQYLHAELLSLDDAEGN